MSSHLWTGCKNSINDLQLCTVDMQANVHSSALQEKPQLTPILKGVSDRKLRTLDKGMNDLRNPQENLFKSSSTPRLWGDTGHS